MAFPKPSYVLEDSENDKQIRKDHRTISSVLHPPGKTIDTNSLSKPITYKPFLICTDRSKALYRLVQHIAVQQKLEDKEVFDFIRFSVRFPDIYTDKEGDELAMVADSDADKRLIESIEVCMNKTGFVVLRALAAIREFGNQLSQGLGLFAIIRCDTLLQPYLELINLLYMQTAIYLRNQYTALAMVKMQCSQQEKALQFFALLENIPQSDMHRFEGNRQLDVVEEGNKLIDTRIGFEIAIRNDKLEWLPRWTFGRLLRQAVRMEKKEIDAEEDPALLLKRMKDKDTRMDQILGGGTSLYSAYHNITSQLQTALSIDIRGHTKNDPSEIDVFILCQSSLPLRIKLVEAVSLSFAIDKIYHKSSDARRASQHMCNSLLQADLDSLVLQLSQDA